MLPRGSRFGDLRLTGYVGRGGFSDVYEAFDANGRRLAVKVLRMTGLDVERQGERVSREREVLSRIDSRGVARLVSSDLASDTPWIASEFVDGPTLRESVLRDGVFSEEEAYGLVRHLAEVLAGLHSNGIAHRDITPNNVILGPDGPVLIDFGSARMDLESESTGSLLLAGTHGYAPPEALRGDPVGRSGDMYSLARVAQFCLTGKDDKYVGLLAGLESLLDDDPRARADASDVVGLLGRFRSLPTRHHARSIEKLPRRFRARSVVAVSMVSILLATGASAWTFSRTSPVRTISGEEHEFFSSGKLSDDGREFLGSPYFDDPFVPEGATLRHTPLGLGESDVSPVDVFVTSRTLGAFAIDDSPSEVGHMSVTAEPAPRWLMDEGALIPRTAQIPVEDFGLMGAEFAADSERLRTLSCVLSLPTHGSYLENFDAYILGTSRWCGEGSAESRHRHFYYVFQPSSRTVFRLYGSPLTVTRDDALRVLMSILRVPSEGFSSVVDLAEGEIREDLLSEIGYSVATMPTALERMETLGFEGRVAISLPSTAVVVPAALRTVLNVWALTDDPTSAGGASLTFPVGSFNPWSQEDWPLIPNSFGLDMVLIIHASWQSGDVPNVSLLRTLNDENLVDPVPVLDALFGSFGSEKRYFGALDLDLLREQVEATELDDPGPGVLGPALVASIDWDLHLADRQVPVSQDDLAAVRLGEIVVPLPLHLVHTSASVGGITYAARSSPFGQRAGVIEASMGTHLMIRNSAVVLPGSTGQASVADLVALPDCRTVAEGYRMVGPLQARMVVFGNCILETTPSSLLTSNDTIRSIAPRLLLTLEMPRVSDYPLTDEGNSLEVLAVEMTLGYSQDVAYVELLLEALSFALTGMSAEEARKAFGEPVSDDGLIDSYSSWLATKG